MMEVLETLLGAGLAAFGAAATATWAWVGKRATERREDRLRADERHRAEVARIRTLYVRVAQLACEYRQTGGTDWKDFISRFTQLKAELNLEGSEAVRTAFHQFLHDTQGEHYENERSGFTEEFWEHFDARLERLTAVMRADLEALVRLSLPANRERSLLATSSSETPPARPLA